MSHVKPHNAVQYMEIFLIFCQHGAHYAVILHSSVLCYFMHNKNIPRHYCPLIITHTGGLYRITRRVLAMKVITPQ